MMISICNQSLCLFFSLSSGYCWMLAELLLVCFSGKAVFTAKSWPTCLEPRWSEACLTSPGTTPRLRSSSQRPQWFTLAISPGLGKYYLCSLPPYLLLKLLKSKHRCFCKWLFTTSLFPKKKSQNLQASCIYIPINFHLYFIKIGWHFDLGNHFQRNYMLGF